MLLPLPQGTPDNGKGTYDDPVTFTGYLEVAMKPGTPFVLPIVAWLGERYDGPGGCGCPDDPPLPQSATTAGPIIVTLDGVTLIEGTDTTGNVTEFYYGPAPLEINYLEPSPYKSTGVIFAQGVGFVHAPLNPGEHILTLDAWLRAEAKYLNQCDGLNGLYANGQGYHYVNTWKITVVPPGKR